MKPGWKVIVSTILLLAGFRPAFPQAFDYPYYGKNRINFEKYAWKSYPTGHFKIYHYIDDIQILKNVAEAAESSYNKLSGLLKHELQDPVPLLYYKTFTDFEQSNLFQPSEGTLGVSEPLLHRVGMYGDMPLDEYQVIMEHELAHIFEFDILWGKQGAALYAVSQPPLWVFEGFSEYATGQWSPWSSLLVRDAVLNDRIPPITESGEIIPAYPTMRDPAYDFGHAIYEFLEARYGENAVRELWQALRNSPLIGRRDPLKRAFGLGPRDFAYEFKKYLREKNRDFLLRENPESYSNPLGPEFPLNPYFFTFSQDLSPSGDIVAAVTYNVRDYDFDIVLISAKTGAVIKNITTGYTTRYEYIKYQVEPAKGKTLAWSPDGDQIAFFARDGQRFSLFLLDPLSDKILHKFRLAQDQPSCPNFLPSGREIIFSGLEGGVADIFKLTIADGTVVNLTKDRLYERAPAVSPDGKRLVYSVRVKTSDQLFLSPLENPGKKTQLTYGPGNAITPSFSRDGREVYFSEDSRGAYNICSVNLESGELRRYTDVQTGNFYPVPDPRDSGILVFSAFNKGSFQIFRSPLEGRVEKTIVFQNLEDGREKVPVFSPIVSLSIEQDKIKAYKGIGKLYLASRPPVDAVVATDGSIYGGSAIAFQDLIGDHSLYFMAYQVRGFRSYYLTYLNQRRRFQYMASAYQYTLFYYPNLYYYDPVLWERASYRDAMASRSISGASLVGLYPFNRYTRLETSLNYSSYSEDFIDPYTMFQQTGQTYGYFQNGTLLSVAGAVTGETTAFRQYGPATGHTFRIGLTQAIPLAQSYFSNTTLEADLRRYLYLGSDMLLAFRFWGVASRGRNPFYYYWGGNNQVRSAYYYSVVGNEGWYANAELRIPLASSIYSLLGAIGPVRGVLFFDVTRAKYKGYPAKIYVSDPPDYKTLAYDAVGTFGYGIEFFFLGFPLHLEFAKSLRIADFSKPFNWKTTGNFETKFWIGLDF